ncbi:MAG: aspartate/glutamate racemase family protein [Haliea sp.]|nr:MAG: aspartate/glutamate racemase family protein [Haliea sp.]
MDRAHIVPPGTRTVGILGGMGPAAGADFARLFVMACADHLRAHGIAVSDQAFPEHWLAQVPVPDRSSALESPALLGSHQPLDPMLQAVGKLAALGATAVAVACNTAHAWHETLQARFPQIEVLHVAREVARTLAADGVRDIGLLATEGTYRTGLYDRVLRQAGVVCHVPLAQERERLMQGIYQGVKAGQFELAQQCFASVAAAMVARHGLSTLVLGCTEIPLALTSLRHAGEPVRLVDPAKVLASALAERAYGPMPLALQALQARQSG